MTANDIPTLLCPSVPPGANRLGVSDYTTSSTINITTTLDPPFTTQFPRPNYDGFFRASGKFVKASEIRDGLSNTFLLFEDGGRPQQWSQGKPVSGTPSGSQWGDPLNQIVINTVCKGSQVMNCSNNNEIYSFHGAGCNFLFGDGSVRYIADSLSLNTFVSLYTRAAGDVPGSDY